LLPERDWASVKQRPKHGGPPEPNSERLTLSTLTAVLTMTTIMLEADYLREEIERLEQLLIVARAGLREASEGVLHGNTSGAVAIMRKALRRSDPSNEGE